MTTSGHRQPEYYQSSIETIDCILACGYQSSVGFCRGNVIKYTMRYQHKGGIGDLKKASWYMNLLYAIESYMEDERNKANMSADTFFSDPKYAESMWSRVPTARELMGKYGRP